MVDVQLSDLDPAGSADDADLALIRKGGTTDYKVTVALLRQISMSGLPIVTGNPAATDLMMLSQAGTNRQIQ